MKSDHMGTVLVKLRPAIKCITVLCSLGGRSMGSGILWCRTTGLCFWGKNNRGRKKYLQNCTHWTASVFKWHHRKHSGNVSLLCNTLWINFMLVNSLSMHACMLELRMTLTLLWQTIVFDRRLSSFDSLATRPLFILQNLWVLLKENGISVKTLVAVISHFIHGGKSKTSNLEQRLHALQAASLYLLLLKIPGKITRLSDGDFFLQWCYCRVIFLPCCHIECMFYILR